MFATDRDLLAIDPTLFTTISFVSQRLISGVADIANSQVQLAEQSLNFEDAGIAPGHVVNVAGASYEVLQRIDKWTLQISALRTADTDPGIPVPDAATVPVAIFTFAPQLTFAERELRNELGLDSAAALINWREFVPLECLYALRHIYAAVGLYAAASSNSPALREALADRIVHTRRGLIARIDTNNDTRPDLTRTLTQLTPTRA